MDPIELVRAYLRARDEETAATVRRVALGDEIARLLPHPNEGSKTSEVGDYKVTVKGVVNRKVDWEAFDAIKVLNPPCKTKREIDVVGLRWYADNDPDTYKRLAAAITSTPGRTQVEVKNV